MHSSTTIGSHTFSTVQLEYQKGKLPLENFLPSGQRYLENSAWYHEDPPSWIKGGPSGQGNTTVKC